MTRLTLLSVLFAIPILSATEARGSAFYYEFQGGASKIMGGAGFGAAANGTLAHSFSGGGAPIDAQLGLQHRLVTGSLGTTDYRALQTSYLIARLQLSRIYVGAGFAPLVWRRAGTSSGIDNFSRATGTTSVMVEAGFLWAVTPQFSLGAAGAAQSIFVSGVRASSPALDGTVVMRFYFGFSKGGGSSSSREQSNEFHGWRYPFGNEMR